MFSIWLSLLSLFYLEKIDDTNIHVHKKQSRQTLHQDPCTCGSHDWFFRRPIFGCRGRVFWCVHFLGHPVSGCGGTFFDASIFWDTQFLGVEVHFFDASIFWDTRFLGVSVCQETCFWVGKTGSCSMRLSNISLSKPSFDLFLFLTCINLWILHKMPMIMAKGVALLDHLASKDGTKIWFWKKCPLFEAIALR